MKYRGKRYVALASKRVGRADAETINTVLRKLRDEFVADHGYKMTCEINRGFCYEFAEEAEQILTDVGIDVVYQHSNMKEEDLIQKLYGPDKSSVEDVEDEPEFFWSVDDGWGTRWVYGLPLHAWIEIAGRVYDAEVVRGVDTWQQLPLFVEFFSEHPETAEQYERF